MTHLPLSALPARSFPVTGARFFGVRSALPQFALAVLLSSGLTGCEYWWQRGQPPAVATMMNRAQAKFQTAATDYKSARPEILPTSLTLAEQLNKAVEGAQKKQAPAELLAHLKEARSMMMELEGKLSVGSRSAHNELNGQLRALIENAEKGEKTDVAALGLYTARVQSFLANELSVPAPVIWHAQPKA